MSKRKIKGHRHPARKSRAVRRREAKERFIQPDASEQAVQTLNRKMRARIQEAPDGDGLVSGPLAVAAEHLAPQLRERHGLGLEHEAMIVQYLTGCWGEVAHAFPGTPELPGYFEWQERSRERIVGI